MEKLRPAVSVEEDFSGWEANLICRLAAKNCSDYVFDKNLAKIVESSKTLILNSRNHDWEFIEKVGQLYGPADSKPLGKTRSRTEKEEDLERLAFITKIEEAEQAYKEKGLERAALHVKLDTKAWSCIQEDLKGSIIDLIRGMTARKAYLEVQKMYGITTHSKFLILDRELATMTMNDDLSPAGVATFLEKRRALINQLQLLAPDELIYSWEVQRRRLADVLPEDFVTVRRMHVADRTNVAKMTYFELCEEIRAITDAPYYADKHTPKASAFYNAASKPANNNKRSNQRNNKPRPHDPNQTCVHCKQVGHHVKDCVAPGARECRVKWYKNNKKKLAARPSQQAHTAIESESRNITLIATKQALRVTNPTSTDQWIVDSGATSHFTNQLKWLFDYKPFHTPLTINAAKPDSNPLVALGSGKAVIKTHYMTISLLDVMYVPEITENLLSMGALDEKGIAFTGSGGQQQFYKDGDLVGSSTKRGKLYILDGITTVNPDAHL
ncbi:protein of unknown function, partial [Taphrina deformans PYCC 5710]